MAIATDRVVVTPRVKGQSMKGVRQPALQPCGLTTICRLMTLLGLCYGVLAVVVAPVPARAGAGPSTGPRYFQETGHNVPEYFANYWAANGGLHQFGFPITEPYSQDGRTIQWFERARFERHLEHKDTPYEVLLGQLGREVRPADPPTTALTHPAARYFPETGHNLLIFRLYWEQNGGLARFGYPLTDELREVSQVDGQEYTVQYFERARLEYHPENRGTPFDVLLGLIGHEQYTIVKANDAAAAAAATPVPPPVTAAAPPSSMELLMWQTINADRAAAGVPPLAYDPLVSRAAAIHVEDMIANDFLEHTGTDGSRPIDRMRQVGVQVQWGSENISMECAKDPATAVKNIRAWMMAEPLADGVYNHHWNLMYTGYTRVGIAFGVAKNGCWVMSQNFADGTSTPGSQTR